ncbi:MAG: ATP-binding cassette domain-containing protein [Clostridia bacterium]|nr:ATP-binding cassette domain-containing protein [Clostridia bacterium]
MKEKIKLEGVSFKYSRRESPAIKDICFSLKSGEFVLLTGPAGAGKSTFANCLNGVIPHFQKGEMGGNIYLEGVNTKDLSTGKIATKVGSVFQDPEGQIICAQVDEEIAYGLENLGLPPRVIAERIDEVLHLVGIEDLRNRATNTLSGGQKQRVATAAVLAMEPKVLILDEPTSELDPQGTEQVIQLLHRLNREKNIAILLIEQKVEDAAPYADRLVVLREGEIIREGAPAQVLMELSSQREVGIEIPQFVNLAKLMDAKKSIPLDILQAKTMVRNYLRGWEI